MTMTHALKRRTHNTGKAAVFILVLQLLFLGCSSAPTGARPEQEPAWAPRPQGPPINGLLIDSARLLERREYYFRLVDFLADWNVNTLVWHFSDDHGCAIRIPGFERLAMPNAFTPEETKDWIRYARHRGVDIIPELESYGHSRYITDDPAYRSLLAGKPTTGLRFGGLDPINPRTLVVIEGLIRSVAALFPSPYLHLGGDEIDVSAYCLMRGVDETRVSAAYLNRLIRLAHACGKYPMLWDDYILKHGGVASRLEKRVVLVHWNYDPDVPFETTQPLKSKGFDDILLAPAISSWHVRILPSAMGLRNTRAMAEICARQNGLGVITSMWLPVRYLQNAMYYGIAYSGDVVAHRGVLDLARFHADFARKVFDLELTPGLNAFLADWTRLEFDVVQLPVFQKIQSGTFRLSRAQRRAIADLNALASRLLLGSASVRPARNTDVWSGMRLAVETGWAVSEAFLIKNGDAEDADRIATFPRKLDEVVAELDREWDRTRDPDSPSKYNVKFNAWPDSYLLVTMRKLKDAFRPRNRAR